MHQPHTGGKGIGEEEEVRGSGPTTINDQYVVRYASKGREIDTTSIREWLNEVEMVGREGATLRERDLERHGTRCERDSENLLQNSAPLCDIKILSPRELEI